ncbi:hypothetical protein SSX86_028967 [Deinandra increscens subsp. villosa]|uniref:UBC core domain-containing protein n=1 Tax=Deinandra increscens subsp. villosa TaxID=3103831 RepID=A0AAP0CBQ6_9ASTR
MDDTKVLPLSDDPTSGSFMLSDDDDYYEDHAFILDKTPIFSPHMDPWNPVEWREVTEENNDDAIDEQVEKKWEVMFTDGDAIAPAMSIEVEKTWMGVYSYIHSFVPPKMYGTLSSPGVHIILNVRLPAKHRWSRPSRFQAFCKKYRSSFLDLMKYYVRAGVYQLDDVLPENRRGTCQTVIPDDKDVLSRYKNFKRFAKVADDQDHLFYKLKETYTELWEARILAERRVLRENMPEMIYVRAYESRMDLLRAVIIGPKGTPYHDGLFFFDVHFPPMYPYCAPTLRYHSFGFAMNPHMFKCGEVRLNIIKTFELMIPKLWRSCCTTVLELLVSIKDKILKEDPLFLQPGLLQSGSSVVAEYFSLLYNEDILINSLKTMVHIIDNPPKHFEDFVVGHFHNRERHILEACEAYMKGLRAGAVVGSMGGNRDKCCSMEFKKNVESCRDGLVNCFNKTRAIETKNPLMVFKHLQRNILIIHWKYLISSRNRRAAQSTSTLATIMDQ